MGPHSSRQPSCAVVYWSKNFGKHGMSWEALLICDPTMLCCYVVMMCCVVLCCVVLCCVVLCCVVLCCAEGAVTKRQRPGCLPTGTGKRAGLCVLCARCV